MYIKLGADPRERELTDCVKIEDGVLVAIKVDAPVEEPVSQELLGKNFIFDGECYRLRRKPRCVMNTADLREALYANGFWCEGIHYIRWKRSSGSSRVGKCLFIDESLYPRMHKYEMCGLKIKSGDDTDLAALESYISLPLSSIIDIIDLDPKSILIIPDYESEFEDKVISVFEEDGVLQAEKRTKTIRNSIWDGQGLIDPSAMGKYADFGMILLRNRFFKCCCFNCNIQDWFRDRGITSVSELNGYTKAEDLSQIKLITTPSSIKYIKFGKISEWLDHIDGVFGVVKHDKKTHFFDGECVQTHYQLLNTLQMTKDEVREFLEPSFSYITQLLNDPSVLRYHIKYPIERDFEITPANSRKDIVYKMLGVNDKFAETKLYYDFKSDIVKAYVKNIRLGRVTVEGNYSTLLGNPLEMLKQAVGQFDGTSSLQPGEVHTVRFPFNGTVLASRSPHISMSNVWLPVNRANEDIDRYFNLTPEILCVNSINDNVLNRLAGCDFDSDTVMITDNPCLINAAKKNYGRFPIAVSDVGANKRKRRYLQSEACDLDIKTSNNLIGDIINLSQELNTKIWQRVNEGASTEDVMPIYMDVCKLNVMSNLEIDKAKKEFTISNSTELALLRKKYEETRDDRRVKPYFFAYKDKGKGYYEPGKKNYYRHDTTMDYLEECISSFRASRAGKTAKKTFIPFSDLLKEDSYEEKNVTRTQVRRVISIVENHLKDVSEIFLSSYDPKIKYEMYSRATQEIVEYIGQIDFTANTMIFLCKEIERHPDRKIGRLMFNTFFGYPNTSFYSVIKNSAEPVPSLERSVDGEIELYGKKYTKIYKKGIDFADNRESENL